MRGSLKFWLAVVVIMVLLNLAAMLVGAVLGGAPDGSMIVRNLLMALLWGIWVVVAYEVVRAFILVVRFLEQNLSDSR